MLAQAGTRLARAFLVAVLVPALLIWTPGLEARRTEAVAIAWVSLADLPSEARATLARIRAGGPFPYERDGVSFGNFERRLPAAERGYYREYTVPTPGLNHRGVRRIVAGRGGELYYTDDHYRTFRRIQE
jgi:ribonuclease T1